MDIKSNKEHKTKDQLHELKNQTNVILSDPQMIHKITEICLSLVVGYTHLKHLTSHALVK
jgi:hypothetical protein